ncbi:MAG: c-type cytochrome [Pirellulaceae bacterium]
MLASAARDESALVRAEAVKAAIEFEGLSAAEVIFEVATRPLDPELNDVLAYARGRINVDHMISEAIASQTELSDAAQAYAIATAAPDLLLKMRKSPKVYNALLSREGIPAKYRREALEAMAKAHDRTLLQQLVATLKEAEAAKQSSLNDLAAMLPSIATETGDDKSLLKQVADQTGSSVVRSAAYTALLMSDSSPQLWRHAVSSRQHLQDFLTSVRKVAGKEQAEVFFPLVRQLLFELPESLRSGGDDVKSHDGPAVSFEYYAPNPKDVSIETLNGLQPALTGQIAKFETFVPGGAKDAFATRQTTSIAVPSTGEYTFYLASDDGSRMVLDGEEIIDNDGLHGIVEKSHKVRLDAGMHALVVTYFDNGGGDGLQVSWEGPGFTKQVLDATVLRPPGSGNLKQQALEVIAAWPGHLDQKIQDFSKLIVDDSLTATAIRAMSALPSKTVSEKLSQDESIAILKRLLERAAAATPVEQQTDAFTDMLRLGTSLVSVTDAAVPDAAEQLKKLRAGIPVKADPKVMQLGAEVYARESHCATCHQPSGQGLPNLYPPIDGSLWTTGNEDRLIRLVLDGMHGTIEVKGKRYSSPPLPPMTGFRHLLNDEEIAAVLTYVRNSWSNRAKPITAQHVARMRGINRGEDASFWSAVDLLAEYPMEDGSVAVAQASTDGWIPKLIKEWKATDFSPSDLAEQGRSFESGERSFKRIGCIQCHKVNDEGGVFGPDLAKLEDKKRNAAYILGSMLDPSKDIDDKYAMRSYLTTSGELIAGFVVSQTDDEIHVKSDPLNQDKPTVVLKDDIEFEKKNEKSAMPTGLLNYFTKEEILDLVAYVLAGGNRSSDVYKK